MPAPLAEPRPVIVVIDDDPAVLNSLKFWLELEGFAVWAYSDASALPSARELPARGCLLIDYRLPGTSGLELLAKLRARHVTLPACLITSHPDEQLRERAACAGVRIIEKPLFGNALTDYLREAFAPKTPRPA